MGGYGKPDIDGRKERKMISYIWPVALVVVSTVLYQICAKSLPGSVDPMASLTVTYLVGAAVSAVMYFLLGGRDLLQEYQKLNWVSFATGILILGLEIGSIYTYKAGWQVSTAYLVHSAIIVVVLLGVGYLAYHEALTWSKLLGAAVIMVGLVLINK